jgi:predicted MFS family arabinose efflux permease
MTRRDLPAIALAAALIPLNSTLIALALPEVARSLDSTLGATSWLVSAYLIAMVSVQPVAGRLGDRLGHARAVRLGLGGFALASLAAAAAPDLPLLIAARVLQGCAGAAIFANGLALLRALPADERGRGIGFVTAALSVAPAIGLPLGGLLLEVADWRALFLLNVPVVLLVLALRLPRGSVTGTGVGFDLGGAVLLSLLLAGSAALLEVGDELAPALLVAAAAALLLTAVAFTRQENRHPDPVIPPRLFRQRGFAAATAGIALGNLAMYVALLAVPLLASSGAAGLLLAGFTAAAAIASAAAGRLTARAGGLAAGGLALLAVALIPLAAAGDEAGDVLIAACMVAAGAGLGAANVALLSAGMEALAARDAGLATSVLNTGRYLGAIVASSLLALLAQDGSGTGPLFAVAAGAAALAAALAVKLGRRRSVQEGEKEA